MKHTLRKLLALLICLALLLSAAALCYADAGGYAGNGDYGGGGSRSSSGDSDSDGGLFILLFELIAHGGKGGIVLAVLIVLVLVAVFLLKNRKAKRAQSRYTASRASAGSMNQDIRKILAPMDTYQYADKGFDGEALRRKLSNLYVQLQEAWTAKDLSPMRPYFSDAFYAQLDRQLQAIVSRGQTNYVERIAVLSVSYEGWNRQDGNDHIYAILKTRIVDYTVDDATKKVVSGSSKAEKFMTYRWHLERPTGQTTTQQSGTRSLSCPHCGAPLNINETAKCPYCDSIITVEQHDFVLTEIEAISQQTGR